jgi:hypothetical protein
LQRSLGLASDFRLPLSVARTKRTNFGQFISLRESGFTARAAGVSINALSVL